MNPIMLERGDALIIVDVQNDFLPGGALAIPGSDEIVDVLNRYIELFHRYKLPIIATRDWHPPNYRSFKEQGGVWPTHCVQHTPGAAFSSSLALPKNVTTVSKATLAESNAYSAFSDTDLRAQLDSMGVRRILIGGLATDYCVVNTVLDAAKAEFSVLVLLDAIRAINLKHDDEARAIHEMQKAGAHLISFDELQGPTNPRTN